jgi:phenylalanyl-tRNA synthetase beta chain
MYISRDWLDDFITIPTSLTAEQLALKMTMHCVEVEGFEILGKFSSRIVVGKINEIKSHPKADKLKICLVNIGKKQDLNVVCGGINLKKDMICAVALPGSGIKWHGRGEAIEVKKTLIRDIISEAVICSADEIGLSDLFVYNQGEILDLTNFDIKIGEPVFKALDLGDTVYDIDNKTITHRPDLWGHYGMARDIAAFLDLKFDPKEPPVFEHEQKELINVKITNPIICHRYIMFVMQGIEVAESPFWLKKRLSSVGLTPINNIVDISNYIMFELGHPLHIFDYDKLDSNQIEVRFAKEAEKFITLEGKELSLDRDSVVISAKDEPVLLGGIIGGEKTKVSKGTKRVILEIATFDSVITRKTAQRLAQRTEASMRYEKSLDPEICDKVLKRTVQLIKQINPNAKVISNIVDIYNKKFQTEPIILDLDFLRKRSGVDFSKDRVVYILDKLGFNIEKLNDKLKVFVPSWRATKDISIPEDLLEEVCRIYGYDNIEIKLPKSSIKPPIENKERKMEKDIKDIAIALGFIETYNYSFLNSRDVLDLGLSDKDNIKLINPVSEDHTLLRRNLIPHLFNNWVDNLKYSDKLAFFEYGRVFIKEKKGEKIDKNATDFLPCQDKYLGFLYYDKNNKIPFFELKGRVEQLFEKMFLKVNFEVLDKVPEWAHPYRICQLTLNDKFLGIMGELHPYITTKVSKDSRVAVIQLNTNVLLDFYTKKANFCDIVKFPEVLLDLAIVIDKDVLWKDIKKEILQKSEGLIKNIEVFDVYQGDKIPKDKKSIAFHLHYQALDKTLDMKRVNDIQESILESLKRKYDAYLRE